MIHAVQSLVLAHGYGLDGQALWFLIGAAVLGLGSFGGLVYGAYRLVRFFLEGGFIR